MSGGIAYVFDEQPEENTGNTFADLCNPGMVDLDPLAEDDFEQVRELIRNHFKYTSSKRALEILNAWEEVKTQFIKVMPRDYKRVLAERKNTNRNEGTGVSSDDNLMSQMAKRAS